MESSIYDELETKSVRMTFTLDPRMADKLKESADKNCVSRSAFVSMALGNYFQQQEMLQSSVDRLMNMIVDNPDMIKYFSGKVGETLDNQKK